MLKSRLIGILPERQNTSAALRIFDYHLSLRTTDVRLPGWGRDATGVRQRSRPEGLGSTMSARNRSEVGARIFMVLHEQVYEMFVQHEKRRISIRYRECIETLQGSENQRIELRKFYRRHSAFFSEDVGKGKQIELHAPKDAADFLQTLAFFVLGRRNVSHISRLLMYHCAVKNNWLPAPQLGTAKKQAVGHQITGAAKVIPVAPMRDKRSDRRLQRVNVNSIFSAPQSTKRDLAALASLTRLGKSATLRYLIAQSADGAATQEIRLFYKKQWAAEDRLRLQQGVVQIRYRNTEKLDRIMDDLVYTIIGEDNRSRALRTIIAYNINKHNLRV